MTATPSPADRIRAAAQKVRDLAKDATPGPWLTDLEIDGWRAGKRTAVRIDGGRRIVTVDQTRPHEARGEGNCAWIATLSPAVAEPLAAVLDTIAVWADDSQRLVDDGLMSGPVETFPGMASALALADALGVEGGT